MSLRLRHAVRASRLAVPRGDTLGAGRAEEAAAPRPGRSRPSRSPRSRASPSTGSPTACASCSSPTRPSRRSRSTSPTSSARATRTTARPAWRTCSSTCSSRASPKHPNINAGADRARRAARTARTWFDRTNYFETFQATDENLRVGARVRGGPHGQRLRREEGPRQRDDRRPQRVRDGRERPDLRSSQERVLSTAFLWHNYGKSTIGARADLENVPIDRLQAFYRTYYQPDNAVLLVAGKLRRGEDARARRPTCSARIPRAGARRCPATYTLDPTQDGERQVTLERKGDVQAIAAAYHVPSGATPTRRAVDLLTEVLTSTPVGPPLQGARRNEEGGLGRRLLHGPPRPGLPDVRRRGPADQSLADARAAMVADARRGRRDRTRSRTKRSTGRARRCSRTSS